MERLRDMRNLGERSEEQLRAVGITTPSELADVGSVEAFARLRDAFPGVSRVFLYALEGALVDERWDRLPPELRDDLARRAGLSPVRRAAPSRSRAPRPAGA